MQNIKQNFGYQFAYRILTVITPLITSPILSRALGAERLGVYSATQAYANYFMLFAMLGIENYGNRTIAAAKGQAEKQTIFWSIYSVQIISSSISCLAYLLSLFLLGNSRFEVLLLQGLWIISCFLDINWFFFGCEQFKITVTRNFFVKIMSVVLIILLVREPEDLYVYTGIMAGSTAISQLLLWFSIKKIISFEKVSWKSVRKHIRPILVLFVPVLAISIFHIMDKTMLDIMSTEEEVGYYYSADKVINIPLGLISAVSTVMLPRMSYIIHNDSEYKVKQMLKKSIELTVFLTCAVAFGIAAIASEFVPFFFGAGFDECITLVYLFVPVLLVKALGELIRSQYLIPSTKDKLYTNAVIGGAVANIVFNSLLIPHYAARGAVAGTFLAELTVLVIQIIGCRKKMNFGKEFLRQSGFLLAGVIMFLIVRGTVQYINGGVVIKLLFSVVVGSIIYLSCCFVICKFKKESIFKKYLIFRFCDK